MASYGYVWLCMAMYGYVGLCRAVYVYVWLCMAVHGFVEPCMAMDVGVCLCSRMYARIDLFVQITRDVSWGIHGLLTKKLIKAQYKRPTDWGSVWGGKRRDPGNEVGGCAVCSECL